MFLCVRQEGNNAEAFCAKSLGPRYVFYLYTLCSTADISVSDLENGLWLEQTLQGWVQTLLQHSHRQFFHVLRDGSDQHNEASLTANPVQVDRRRVEEILAHLPGEESVDSEDEEQPVSVRDIPVWLISTGIYDFVEASTKSGMPAQDLSQLISTAVARSGPLTSLTQKWLADLTVPLVKHSVLLMCKIVSNDP